jgi:hypothetical protein
VRERERGRGRREKREKEREREVFERRFSTDRNVLSNFVSFVIDVAGRIEKIEKG